MDDEDATKFLILTRLNFNTNAPGTKVRFGYSKMPIEINDYLNHLCKVTLVLISFRTKDSDHTYSECYLSTECVSSKFGGQIGSQEIFGTQAQR